MFPRGHRLVRRLVALLINTKLEHGNPATSRASTFIERTFLVASTKPDLSSVDQSMCVPHTYIVHTYAHDPIAYSLGQGALWPGLGPG